MERKGARKEQRERGREVEGCCGCWGAKGGRDVGRDKTELPPRRLGDDLGGSEFILNLVGLRSTGREALSPP